MALGLRPRRRSPRRWRSAHSGTLQASLVPVMDSEAVAGAGLASRPMKTTWPSVPPTSAQLVISPVASWAICSTLRSATGLLG